MLIKAFSSTAAEKLAKRVEKRCQCKELHGLAKMHNSLLMPVCIALLLRGTLQIPGSIFPCAFYDGRALRNSLSLGLPTLVYASSRANSRVRFLMTRFS